METLKKIIENIIKSKAGVIPVFIYDEMKVFEDVVKDLGDNIDISILKSNSKIAMQDFLYNFDGNKYCAIYSSFNIDIDGLVVANKLIELNITPMILLEYYDKTKDKLHGEFDLIDGQYKLFINNLDFILEDIKDNKTITKEILKDSLAKVFIGKSHTPRYMMISFIKGDFSLNDSKELYLYDKIRSNIKDHYNIDIKEIDDNKDLFERILISLLMEEHKDIFGAEFNDKIIKISKGSLTKIFNFIKENSVHFQKEIDNINKIFKYKTLNEITYIIPQVFKNYIVKNLENYCNIYIDHSQLWTEEMVIIGDFIDKASYLDTLLKQYVSYTFHTNTMSAVISEYKEDLWEIDNVYREVIGLVEDLSYNIILYTKIKESKIIRKLNDMYFNVIGNINSKYISNYNYLIKDTSNVLRQDHILKKLKFKENTVYIFADGLRYELAKSLMKDIRCKEIIDYDVFSLVPTETEICMNGYFITDEKIRINKRNTFELTKNGKLITQIIKWRIEKLSEILDCPVITFEEFKSTNDYEGSVILFYDDVDITIHKYNSARKVKESAEGLKRIINYSISRGFDVMLLSDHGFLDIETKIKIQDIELDLERKKGRYLILSSGESVDTMYYRDDIILPKFIESSEKNICFINSINSLRKTTKYTHGGISLQENIITAILFRAENITKLSKKEKYILKVEAFNEIRADIINAEGLECSVYAGIKRIYMTIIDSQKYLLRVPIRNYNKGDNFLITITGEDYIEKHTITKAGSTVIDKELDIF